MEKIKLNVQERENKTPNQLRREAKIPATLYGSGEPSKNLQIDEREFLRLPHAAFSHMVELNGEQGKPTSALIRHVQRLPATDKVLNVEFYKVRLDHKITMVVELKFVGTSEAVTQGGQLVESHLEAEIECLPNDIPDFIEVDLSKLVEIDDAIHFGDLIISDKVKILNPHDDVVAKAIEMRVVEEEEKPAAEAPAEGEAAAEGAAAPEAAAGGASAPAAEKTGKPAK